MTAMQYSFALPADYDMDIIDRRIRDKGGFTDGFPNLRFKAYLTSRKGDVETGARNNLYAPFYVWNHEDGLNDFVCGPGFAGVSAAFGRPVISTWIPWVTLLSDGISMARFASREIFAIAPDADLAALRSSSAHEAASDMDARGALASVVAFTPERWMGVRFRLWAELHDMATATTEIYRVGHVSLGDGHAQAPK